MTKRTIAFALLVLFLAQTALASFDCRMYSVKSATDDLLVLFDEDGQEIVIPFSKCGSETSPDTENQNPSDDCHTCDFCMLTVGIGVSGNKPSLTSPTIIQTTNSRLESFYNLGSQTDPNLPARAPPV